MQALKEQLPSYESQFTQLFEQGSAMLEKMAANEEPYQYVDQQLSSFEQRWANLVTQESGAIDKLESAVRKVRKCTRYNFVHFFNMIQKCWHVLNRTSTCIKGASYSVDVYSHLCTVCLL